MCWLENKETVTLSVNLYDGEEIAIFQKYKSIKPWPNNSSSKYPSSKYSCTYAEWLLYKDIVYSIVYISKILERTEMSFKRKLG